MRIKIALFFLYLLSCNHFIQAQNSVASIFLLGTGAVAELEKQGFEVVRVEYDFLSKTTPAKSTFRPLSTGYDYKIIVFSNEQIEDIDLELFDEINEKWEVIREDDSENNIASINFSPKENRFFYVDVTSKKFAEGYDTGRYSLIFAHKESSSSSSTGTRDNSPPPTELSKLNFSTTTRILTRLDENGEPEILENAEFPSLFAINEEVTMIEHTTDKISSNYYVKTKEFSSESGLWSLDVVSDVGNEYSFNLNLAKKQFIIIIKKDGELYAHVYDMKATWQK